MMGRWLLEAGKEWSSAGMPQFILDVLAKGPLSEQLLSFVVRHGA